MTRDHAGGRDGSRVERLRTGLMLLLLWWLLSGSTGVLAAVNNFDTDLAAERLIATEPKRALAQAQALVAQLSAAEDDPVALGLAQLVVGKAALALNELELAEQSLSAAATTLARHGSVQQRWLVDYARARLSFQQGRFDLAGEQLSRALEQAEAAGDPRIEAAMWNLWGIAAARQGRFNEAAERYQRALTLQRSRGDKVAIALCLNNLGNVWKNLGQPGIALDLHLEALDLRRALDDGGGITQSLSNIVLVYQQLGDLGSALRYSEEAVQRTAADHLSEEALRIRINHAGLLVRGARFADALNQLQPLESAIAAAPPLLQREARSTRASALHGLGKAAEARQSADSAVQLAREMAEPKELIDALGTLAEVLRKVPGAAKQERAALEEAAQLAQQTQSTAQERELRLQLAELAEQRGELALALHERRRYEALSEQSAGIATARRIAALERELADAERDRELVQLRANESLQAALISRQRWTGVLGLLTASSLLLLLGWRVREGRRRQQVAERTRAELSAKNAELERLANTDALTGLGNRKWLREQLELLTAAEGPQSLVLLDIDLFKRINDEHGHDAGDAVLVALGRVLQQSLPEALVGRWGGEEFLLLFPGLGGASVVTTVDALRARMAQLPVAVDGALLQVRFSAGVAEKGQLSDSGRWLKYADQALYLAKKAGRDRVELARTELAGGCEPN